MLAATFTIDGKLHTGFRFERDGKPEYFTGDGRPLKKSFIRMPIPYARLTSSFGARRHPVLGTHAHAQGRRLRRRAPARRSWPPAMRG